MKDTRRQDCVWMTVKRELLCAVESVPIIPTNRIYAMVNAKQSYLTV